MGSAQAAPLDLAPGANLNTLAPVSGDTWNLQGHAVLFNATTSALSKALPVTLTIKGTNAGSTITLNDGAGHYGRFNGSGVTLNLSDVALTGGSQSSGGAIGSAATINVSGAVNFIDNRATSSSGGAYYSTESVSFVGTNGANLSFQQNTAALKGGAIASGGAVNITGNFGDISFDGNRVNSIQANLKHGGGAIHSVAGININADAANLIIANNQSNTEGGAFYSEGGNTTISGTYGTIQIKNNQAVTAGHSTGGAIAQRGGGTIFINANADILDVSNNAAYGGGAFSGSTSISGSYGQIIFEGNKALGGGGGAVNGATIAINSTSNANTTDLVIRNNQVTSPHSSGGAFNASNISIAGNYRSITITNNALASASNSGWGGAFQTSGAIAFDTQTAGLLTITDNIGGGGGAFHAYGDIRISGNYGGIVITGNTAFDDWGGALQSRQENVIIDAVSATAIQLNNNSSGTHGGGIFAYKSVEVNPALVANNNEATLDGGAVTAYRGNATFTGGVSMDGNKAGRDGGAIYAAGGSTNISATNGIVSFTNNTAGTNGGAIYSGVLVSIAGSLGVIAINDNKATGVGGGIWGGKITVDALVSGDLTIRNNSAGGHSGGAFYGGSGSISINGRYNDITISGNQTGTVSTADRTGGGAFWAYSDIIIDTVTTGSLTISGNTTGAYGGGAFYADGGAIKIAGSYGDKITIDNNSANGTGGALRALRDLSIAPTQAGALSISNNTSGNVAGALYAGGSVSIFNTNAINITNNTSGTNGGAIMGVGGISIGSNGGDITIAGNQTTSTNTGSGGGAFYSPNNNITINSMQPAKLSITGNSTQITGSYQGGGAFMAFANGSIIINGAYRDIVISDNAAPGGSGGAFNIYRQGSAAMVIDTVTSGKLEIANNSARIQGGAIHSQNISITGVYGDIRIADNNVQTSGGGAFNGTRVTIDTTTRGTLAITGNRAAFGGAINGGVGLAGNSVTLAGAYGAILIDGNIATSGDGGAITAATGGVSLTPSAGTMTVSNNTSARNGGAIFSEGGVTVTAAGMTAFTNNSADLKGGAIWAAGDVTLNATGGDMTFSGNTHGDPVASAIYLNNTAGNKAATFNADAGRTISFYDPIEHNIANGLMNVTKTGSGMVTFDGSRVGSDAERWSKMFANTNVAAGTFEVANGAVYGAFSSDTMAPMATTSFTSASGSMVQGGHVGSIRVDNVTLNGDVSIAGRQSGTRSVLNIASNNLTFGGGTVHFNTHLDNGLSGNTDLLVLALNNNATSGQSFINVANAGGSGAMTIGDGIRLVETNGSGTTDGAFLLGSRVAAGAYEYQLHQGGVDNNADDQNWYLRSTYNPPPTPPGCEFTDTCIPQELVPIIREEVAVSVAIPPLAIEYGYSMLDTLHERVGETALHNSSPVTEERIVWCKDASQNFKCVVRVPVAVANAKDETHWASSGWARLMGERGLHQPDNFSKRGPNYDYTFGGLQAGLDLYAHEQADGTLDKVGIYVGYGQITSNVNGQFGGKAGSVDMDAYTVGGYWTHHAATGWYTDAVIQGTWYEADARSIYGQQIKPDGFGLLASLEGGYSFKLGNGFTIEPQAQVVYQNVSFGNANDAYGLVRFDNSESLRGRLGVRVTKSWNMADDLNPRLVTAWLRANVWHEFMGKTTTSVGSLNGQNMTPFNSHLGGTWGELGAGVTAQVSDKVSLFATGAYHRSLDNNGRTGWDGRLGMTVKW